MNSEIHAALLLNHLNSLTKEQMDAIPDIEGNVKMVDNVVMIFTNGEWIGVDKILLRGK